MQLHYYYHGLLGSRDWMMCQYLLWGKSVPVVLFVGAKGMLQASYDKRVLMPEKDFRDFVHPKESIPKSLGHYAEWIHACKTGSPTTCNFEYAGWLTEANHLGNVAYRAGKKLEWDAAKIYATNAPEAEPFIRREYRKGWNLA